MILNGIPMIILDGCECVSDQCYNIDIKAKREKVAKGYWDDFIGASYDEVSYDKKHMDVRVFDICQFCATLSGDDTCGYYRFAA